MNTYTKEYADNSHVWMIPAEEYAQQLHGYHTFEDFQKEHPHLSASEYGQDVKHHLELLDLEHGVIDEVTTDIDGLSFVYSREEGHTPESDDQVVHHFMKAGRLCDKNNGSFRLYPLTSVVMDSTTVTLEDGNYCVRDEEDDVIGRYSDSRTAMMVARDREEYLQKQQQLEEDETVYVEFTHNGDEVRIRWVGGSLVNIYFPVGGQWVEFDCFTDYGIESIDDALSSAIEYLNDSEQA